MMGKSSPHHLVKKLAPVLVGLSRQVRYTWMDMKHIVPSISSLSLQSIAHLPVKIAKQNITKQQEILPSSATRFATKLGSGCCAFATPGRELAARPPEIHLGTVKIAHEQHKNYLITSLIFFDFGKSYSNFFWQKTLLPPPCPRFHTRNSTLHRVASSFMAKPSRNRDR